jgi:leucyl/phenylalanyl-tRNA--protein transferase
VYRLPQTNLPLDFPDDFETSSEGLLAIDGNLHPQTLINAYRKGIFPWFSEGDPILWWHPDPRMVLKPDEIRISKSMQKVRRQFEKNPNRRFTVNEDFVQVMRHCAHVKRKGQDGTWITSKMLKAYTLLHEKNYAHSYEIWWKDSLVAGLYGITLGKVFFGESMFSLKPNMSKLALIYLCERLIDQNFLLIDCQQETKHLASMGAKPMAKQDFLNVLKNNESFF